MRSTLALLLLASCADPTPHAIVHARAASGLGLGRAVLVLPTRCTTELGDSLCLPNTYETPQLGVPGAIEHASFAELIDPVLRIKLELAGYTLAEAAAMKVTSGDRTTIHQTTTDEPRTAAPTRAPPPARSSPTARRCSRCPRPTWAPSPARSPSPA